MRLNTVFLADAATIQNGLLNVLGGFVNHMGREDFPAEAAVQLVAVVSLDESDSHEGQVSIGFGMNCHEEGSAETVFEGGGTVVMEGTPPRGTTFPIVMDLGNAPLPAPGQYVLAFELNGEAVGQVLFEAAQT